MDTYTTPSTIRRRNPVVILGQTGCGKTKLSIDLASRFSPSSEINNSDKIQVYRGLDITTNKIPLPEHRHHLLGDFDSTESHPEFTVSDFRSAATSANSQIISCRRLPFIVGGSNSFIHALLLVNEYNPELDEFTESNDSVFFIELSYDCCFHWIDISLPVLNQYLIDRVDDMLDSGIFDELGEYFINPASDSVSQYGLRKKKKKAIRVPEFEGYFKRFKGRRWRMNGGDHLMKQRGQSRTTRVK